MTRWAPTGPSRGAPPGPETTPTISVVIPVHNGARTLARCLQALWQSRCSPWECIVIDDGSTDSSVAIARRWAVRLVRSGRPRGGPAQARNRGAQEARGSLLCFVDADVLVRPDTLAQFVALFDSDPGLAAAFGSYDARPDAPELLSQYRNLLHHFVHQSGREAAATFWSGCGAIRRDVFLALGGFNPEYTRPSIEDIELGYRLRASGGRIRLAKHIQVTHLKRWTFWGILKTDVCDRALPWTALIWRTRYFPADLNLDVASRVSALSVFALVGLVVAGWWYPGCWLAVPPVMAVLLVCNWSLYLFLLRERGLWFLLRIVPMHWLYFAYSALAFGGGLLLGMLGDRWQHLNSALRQR